MHFWERMKKYVSQILYSSWEHSTVLSILEKNFILAVSRPLGVLKYLSVIEWNFSKK